MEFESFEDVFFNHNGYAADKWKLYVSVYQRLFLDIKDDAICLLEIGVQNGGSLQIWRRFFPNALAIVGCDIDERCKELEFNDPIITLVVGDVRDASVLSEISAISRGYDIVIDDGSHSCSDVINSFSQVFPLLAGEGVYVVEDLHCSYWKKWGGGLYKSGTAMDFFKALSDVINHEHWALDVSRINYLRSFGDLASLTESDLSEIHSVQFINSMCVILKRPPNQNILGERVVVGCDELVSPVKHVNGSYSSPYGQQEGGDDLFALLERLRFVVKGVNQLVESSHGQCRSEILQEFSIAASDFSRQLNLAKSKANGGSKN